MTDETLAQEIEAVAAEPVEHVVIGAFGWDEMGSQSEDVRMDVHAAQARAGELLTWQEARPLLDYRWDAGYGAPDCHAVTAWSARWVLFVVQYDGSTGVHRVPRNPVVHTPEMPGG